MPAPYQSRNRLQKEGFPPLKTFLIIPCFVYVYVYVFIYGRTTSYIKSRLAALSPAPRLPLRFAVVKAPAAAGRLASGKLPRPAGSRFQWCRLDLVCGAVTSRERECFFFLKGRVFFGACVGQGWRFSVPGMRSASSRFARPLALFRRAMGDEIR